MTPAQWLLLIFICTSSPGSFPDTNHNIFYLNNTIVMGDRWYGAWEVTKPRTSAVSAIDFATEESCNYAKSRLPKDVQAICINREWRIPPARIGDALSRKDGE